MFADIRDKLEDWENRDDVQCILWRGEEFAGKTKAFCAGGELREVVLGEHGISAFVGPEYRLDFYISRYPKTQICVWNGIVMGAGYGLTAHSQIRLALESSVQFAMPESRFGLFADIGASYLLTQHCPKYLGRYLALTADRIKGQDALWSGIATHLLSSGHSDLPSLFADLISNLNQFFDTQNSSNLSNSDLQPALLKMLQTVVQAHAATKNSVLSMESTTQHASHTHSSLETRDSSASRAPTASTLQGRLQHLYPLIVEFFGRDSIKDVYEKLKQASTAASTQENTEKAEWITFCLEALEVSCCPTSSAVAFEIMKKAECSDFSYEKALINDFRLAAHMYLREDIKLGAMAILNKTGTPKWSPSSIKDVDMSDIAKFFEPLSDNPAGSVATDLELSDCCK
jgi:enoyl-CoA hydratase/carnithine racemase